MNEHIFRSIMFAQLNYVVLINYLVTSNKLSNYLPLLEERICYIEFECNNFTALLLFK